MDTHVFLDHFERLTDAPNAVARLRELVLQLAMQGKLVSQDPNDESAGELLAAIKAQRQRKAQEEQSKAQPSLPPIMSDEIPYELPKGWAWERLGNLGETNIGLTYSPNDLGNTGIPVLRSNNIKNGKIDLSELVRVDTIPKRSVLVEVGDLLICARNGSRALVGKTALIEHLSEITAFGAFMAVFRSSINQYLYYFISSPLFRQMINEVNTTTINQITQSNLRSTIAPVPPLAEQKRIVAKVDELMRLCDELKRAQGERREARQRLNCAALDQLLAARDAAEFQARWQTVSDHFPTLTVAHDQISKLRQTILQLAVQGKLTRQDPQDEPAPTLLRRIRAERERLVKEKKIKRADPRPPVNPDETPFALPNGWVWARLGEFGGFWGGGTPSKSNPEFWQGNIPWVSPKDMKRLYLSDSIDHITEEAVRQSTAQIIPQNSLLFVVRGMILAHSFPVALTLRDVTINQDMKAVQLAHPDTAEFLLLACRGLKTVMLKKVVRSSHGTCRLESEDVERFPIPLPPLGEQKRIVAAVNRLMALCDELETGLRRAEEDGERLLRAAVRSLLAPTLKDEDEQSAELVA
jgi:type I restriction enzyme S subunit